MLVPTASEVLADKLPKFAQTYSQQKLLDQMKTNFPKGTFLDVGETLKQHTEEYIYYKTDHHWTAQGAYYAYEQWAKACEFLPWDSSKFQIEKQKINIVFI